MGLNFKKYKIIDPSFKSAAILLVEAIWMYRLNFGVWI